MNDSKSIAWKRQAIEEIIRASWRAGFEIGAAGQQRELVDPVIEWTGDVPQVVGLKVRS